jgi:hypothetical protein
MFQLITLIISLIVLLIVWCRFCFVKNELKDKKDRIKSLRKENTRLGKRMELCKRWIQYLEREE